jgi:sarcosine oxidase delta subunit
MESLDTEFVSDVTCPYCGYVYRDSWEFPDEDDCVECNGCGETFSMIREVSVTYSTFKRKYGIDLSV